MCVAYDVEQARILGDRTNASLQIMRQLSVISAASAQCGMPVSERYILTRICNGTEKCGRSVHRQQSHDTNVPFF